ncbi:MAG: GDYXXLXY domain-containing protein [Thermoguttaceae bacterium]
MTKRQNIAIGVIAITIIAQVVLLAMMTRSRTDILVHGKQVTFRTAPVDPRDFLRGDYVVLRYPFSTYWGIDENSARGRRDDFYANNNGRFVYVTLVPEPEMHAKWRQDEIETQKKLDELLAKDSESPRRDADGLPMKSWEVRNAQSVLAGIRARLRNTDENLWTAQSVSFEKPTSGTFIRGRLEGGQIVYGIEAYYVQEGSGKTIENAIRNRNDNKIVLVDAAIIETTGEAAIRTVRVVDVASNDQ